MFAIVEQRQCSLVWNMLSATSADSKVAEEMPRRELDHELPRQTA